LNGPVGAGAAGASARTASWERNVLETAVAANVLIAWRRVMDMMNS
jgi:hypothetical protein